MAKLMMIDLNKNQERFAQEIALNPDASVLECYVIAGYAKHMQNAYRLYESSAVQTRVKELQGQHIERLSVSRDQVVEQLAKIAFADIGSILDMYGRVLPVVAWPAEIKAAAVSVEAHPATGVAIGAKFADRMAALRELAKIMGLYNDGQMTNNTQINMIVSEKDLLL